MNALQLLRLALIRFDSSFHPRALSSNTGKYYIRHKDCTRRKHIARMHPSNNIIVPYTAALVQSKPERPWRHLRHSRNSTRFMRFWLPETVNVGQRSDRTAKCSDKLWRVDVRNEPNAIGGGVWPSGSETAPFGRGGIWEEHVEKSAVHKQEYLSAKDKMP